MTLREALERHLVSIGVRSEQTPPGQLYDDKWIRYAVAGKRIPIFPLRPFKDSMAIHDAHHLLTGYGGDLKGEVEVAAWELASGGCGKHWFMWFDRFSLVFGILFFPKAFFAAWKKGWQSMNLYGVNPKEALEMDLESARRRTAESSSLV